MAGAGAGAGEKCWPELQAEEEGGEQRKKARTPPRRPVARRGAEEEGTLAVALSCSRAEVAGAYGHGAEEEDAGAVS